MSTEIPVTRTRIVVPRRRSELLSRQRLLELLDSFLDKKVVIVAAAAGYGKTSLLIDFADQLEIPVCWYAIDPLDNDPQRFIAHLINAIQVQFPKFGKNAMAALMNAPQGKVDVDRMITIMTNDAYENISEHFLMVIDDYHLVTDSNEVNHFISRFCQDVDENAHFIFSSRTLLTLPDLPLMVARNQVGGLSYEELAFQPEEIKALFLQNYGHTLSDKVAETLSIQSEGWITGLLLTSQIGDPEIENRSRITRASGVGIDQYFLQVLEQQSPDVQKFMLRSSLLEEFDAQLCEDVIGQSLSIKGENWESNMTEALLSNLFVLPVGEKGVWLRYHHLFRDFLQEHMRQTLPDETIAIRLRLAQVYAQRSDWEMAYHLYEILDRTDELENLIEQAGPKMMAGGRLTTLANWLDKLPASTYEKRPSLTSIRGGVAVLQGDTQKALRLYDRAIQNMSLPGDRKDLARTYLRRSTSFRMIGDHQSSMLDAEKALELVGEDRTLRSLKAEVQRSIGMNLYHQGNFNEALNWLQESLESYRLIDDHQNESVLLMEIGITHANRSDFHLAEEAYLSALEYWQETNNSVWLANLLNNLGYLQHSMGKFEAAASTLEKAIQHAELSGYQRMLAYALTSIGDLYFDLDAMEEALEAYQRARSVAQAIDDELIPIYLDISEGKIAVYQRDYDSAQISLERAHQTAEEKQTQFELNLAGLAYAISHLKQEQYDQALSQLESVMQYFCAEGNDIQHIEASLYQAICHFNLGSLERSLESLKGPIELITEPEKRASLVTAGWRHLEQLTVMKNDPALYEKVILLTNLIAAYEEELPSMRRRLRHRTSIVPFAPPKIYIRSLGKLQAKLNDNPVTNSDWQTQVARDMFFLLVANPQGLSKEEIGLIFWPDVSAEALKFRFKNAIYRLRHAVGKDAVLLNDDYYYFNRSLDYEYDVENFLSEIDKAQQVEDSKIKIKHLNQAVKLYQGPFLPEISETWVITEREKLHLNYLNTLIQIARLKLEDGQYEKALRRSQQALDEDPCFEPAHRLLMRVHAAMGNRPAVVRQFERCRDTLDEEICTEPSPQTQDLYKTLTK